MKSMQKYWISISQWSLIDSMTTECVSPYSFYLGRCFGSDLSRFIEGSERVNHIFLYTEEPKCDYAIEVSSDMLDKDCITPIDRQGLVFKYPKSVYFKKGMVRFRFANDTLLKSFLAETEIMLEVKATRLYRDDFYVGNGVSDINSCLYDELALDGQAQYLASDDAYNFYKGAVIGFGRGLLTSKSPTDIELSKSLTDLKNDFTGCHTRLMVDDSFCPDRSLLDKNSACKVLFEKATGKQSNSFDVIRLLFEELLQIATARCEDLRKQKTPAFAARIRELENQQSIIEKKLYRIEADFNIVSYSNELRAIMDAEVRNGQAEGKTRKYFPKGSPERERKDQLKKIIDQFKASNSEYMELEKALADVKSRIAGQAIGFTEYDGAIAPIFTKISDVINGIITDSSRVTSNKAVDFCGLEINGMELSVRPNGAFGAAETEYFNILLDSIRNNPLKELRPVSDKDVLFLLEKSCKRYQAEGTTYSSIKGQTIKNALVSFWNYKKHNPAGRIILPEDMPLFSAVIVFFMKGADFMQMERYAGNRGIHSLPYALLLWGAFVGFASIPRTFTDSLYDNPSTYNLVQEILWKLLP